MTPDVDNWIAEISLAQYAAAFRRRVEGDRCHLVGHRRRIRDAIAAAAGGLTDAAPRASRRRPDARITL